MVVSAPVRGVADSWLGGYDA